jgi:hypothetical protein
MKRLTYAKYLYGTAADGLRSTSPIVAAEALLRVHDAVEIFQLVVLDSLGASGKFEFMDFWEKVRAKTGEEPPYKDRFAQLNHMRVGFKHKAITPNPSELRDVAAVVLPFFNEVCRDVLDVDFAKLSMAELVGDPAVREHLGKAEDLMNSLKYGESLAETAIALHLALSQKYPDSPWGAGLSDLLGPDLSSGRPPKIHLPHYDLPAEARDLVRGVEEALERLHEQFYGQARVLEMLIWKIDLQKYSKFAQFVPHVYEIGDGNFQVVERTGIRRPFTRRDARFCFQFVLDSALAMEQQKNELPDLFAAQRIKTIASPTRIFKFEKGSAIPCGQIPAGQELEGVYHWVHGMEDCWQVTWEDRKGFVRSTDVAQIDYD